MMLGTYNGRFWTIKTDLEKKMLCGYDRYPKTKDETVVILNNYYVSKQLT